MQKRIALLLTVAVVASRARAEDVEPRQRLADTQTRLHGVVTMMPMAGGGLVTLGGSNLRVLAPGARRFESLHRIPGDNLYRAVADDSGAVLAAWEKDPSLHYFTPTPKAHRTLARPAAPSPDISHFNVDYLAFLPDGRHALVHMKGLRNTRRWVQASFRIALDGSAPPELLYQVEGALQLHITRDMAVYVMPKNPGQTCDNRTCNPVAAILVYELTPQGVRSKPLLTAGELAMENARMVWGADDDLVVLTLDVGRNQRALLRWRRGDAKAQVRPFTKFSYSEEQLYATATGDVLSLVMRPENELVIERHAPDGSLRVSRLPASTDPNDYDHRVYAIGTRSNGALWLHWGDHLVLFSSDATTPPRAYDLEPLLTRRAEWAGTHVYVARPELLWVGIEVGRGRDFVRLSFNDIEKRARAWRPN